MSISYIIMTVGCILLCAIYFFIRRHYFVPVRIETSDGFITASLYKDEVPALMAALDINTPDITPDEQPPKRSPILRGVVHYALVAAAFVMVINFLPWGQSFPQFAYSTIMELDFAIRSPQNQSVTFDEYENTIGLDTANLFQGYERTSYEVAYVTQPHLRLSGYAAKIVYKDVQSTIMLTIAPFSSLLEDEIKGDEEQPRKSRVSVARDISSDDMFATWENNNLHFIVRTEGMSQAAFTARIREAYQLTHRK